MSSVVTFRSHHVKQDQAEVINFSGNAIRLLDLKREIVQRKNFATSQDFDLKIVDDNGQCTYVEKK